MTAFSQALIDRFQSLKTPFYYYDLALLQKTLDACKREADRYGFHVHYALKANVNPRVLDLIAKAGFGADCVSGGEVRKAVETGFKADQVVFAGVGKSDDEIIESIKLGIFCFNVESVQELQVIDELARRLGKKARVALRINPNVDAKTHRHITTGLEENKFGINPWDFPACFEALRKASYIDLLGLHFHVGSQITDMNVFKELCERVNAIAEDIEKESFTLKILNVGGGLGVDYYAPDENPIVNFAAYFRVFDENLKRRADQQVYFELGRALVAQCCSLIGRVMFIKNDLKKHFAILDAGMTELIRPALYEAYHLIENLTSTSGNRVAYDVVGPICESTDILGSDVELPETRRGDLIAIRSAGAYGEVMASNYNLRTPAASVYSGD